MQLIAMQQEHSTIYVKWEPTMNMQGNVFGMINMVKVHKTNMFYLHRVCIWDGTGIPKRLH